MWTIIGSITLQVFLYCLLTHYLWEHYAPTFLGPPPVVGTGQ
jgi:hypothetical protein